MNNLSRIKIPLLAIPALLVSGATLLILLAAVTGAARDSQPGDVMYPLRAPALELQLELTNDADTRAELLRMLGRPVRSPEASAPTGTRAVDSPQPTRTPTGKPSAIAPTETRGAQATETPRPANIVAPTRTEAARAVTPGATVEPGETETRGATNTPAPVINIQPTQTREATNTPQPANTPQPTEVRQATQTPKPDNTQSPSQTPQATKTPGASETPH